MRTTACLPPALPSAPLVRRRRSLLLDGACVGASLALSPPPASARPVPDERLAEAVFEEVRGSVVGIADYQVRDGAVASVRPLCSGVLWDQRGYLVTSYSAVTRDGASTGVSEESVSSAASSANTPGAPEKPLAPGASAKGDGGRLLRVSLLDVSVSPPELKQFRATLVGSSALHHLAVLLLQDCPQECLSPIQLGQNKDVRVGQAAYTVGLRLGSTHSFSVGVVSGLHRPLQAAPGAGPGLLLPGGALQTDAAAGDATGGALVDSAGRLMGVAVLPPGRKTASSLGFAVPVDVVTRVVPQLIAFGSM